MVEWARGVGCWREEDEGEGEGGGAKDQTYISLWSVFAVFQVKGVNVVRWDRDPNSPP